MTTALQPSAECRALIKSFESLRLRAYKDAVGIWTIGWGHTAGVMPGDVVSERQAEAYFEDDLADAVRSVRRRVAVPLDQGQFDALVSFVFNIGDRKFADSTLLKRLNVGNYAGAEAWIQRWVYAGGKKLPGLVRRRSAEAELFGREARRQQAAGGPAAVTGTEAHAAPAASPAPLFAVPHFSETDMAEKPAIQDALMGALRSKTVWFGIAIYVASFAQEFILPQLGSALPAEKAGYFGMALGVGVIVLRWLTTTSLAEKGRR